MNPAPQTWTVGALLQWTENFFRSKQLDTPRLDAQVLLAHAMNVPRAQLYVRYDEIADDAVRAAYRELVKKRADGVPVAYLVGFKEFLLLKFAVTPAVLIPRPATESLVLAALDFLKPLATPHVLDLCTGSGCIGICIAARMATARLTLTDVSQPAVDVATRNAATHHVVDRCTFLVGDLYASLPADARFDLIVANPPYIRAADLATLSRDVRDYEPRAALDGGPDGFAVIDRLIVGANTFLTDSGALMIEVGHDQAEAVAAKFAAAGFHDVKVSKDADGVPRVVAGRCDSRP